MPTTDTEQAIFDNIRGTRDALSVRRVFGDPYMLDGVTLIAWLSFQMTRPSGPPGD